MSKKLLIFFLTLPNYLQERTILQIKMSAIKSDMLARYDFALVETLLLGDTAFSQSYNWRILNANIAFTLTSKRFNDALAQ